VLLLQQQGIASLLVERRDDVSIYPRARNLNFRSMEVFRGLGLGAEVHSAGSRFSQMILKETLASKTEKTVDPAKDMKFSESLTPEPFLWYCPQNRLEPLLRSAAQQRGADVRYSNELQSFSQDDAGVTATVEERSTGRSYTVRPDYLAACDGAKSPIREELGIKPLRIST
jgi:2-polyprenyl-6-methoxyphenol hydroxylase-like FAD-dependent oxidoreductase